MERDLKSDSGFEEAGFCGLLVWVAMVSFRKSETQYHVGGKPVNAALFAEFRFGFGPARPMRTHNGEQRTWYFQ
jgi:hypothetical protein